MTTPLQERALEVFLSLKRNHPQMHGLLVEWVQERVNVYSSMCHSLNPQEPALPRAQGAYQEMYSLLNMMTHPEESLEEHRSMREFNKNRGVV